MKKWNYALVVPKIYISNNSVFLNKMDNEITLTKTKLFIILFFETFSRGISKE